MWQGSTIYYLSDGGPEHRLNIWRYDTKTAQRKQVTQFTDYDVKWPSIGPGPHGNGEIVFEHGTELELLDLPAGKPHPVEVRVPGDEGNLRPRAVDTGRFVANWSLSPNGKRAAIEARGDIWTAPAKNGTPRNLTHTNGIAERFPAWSPDGRWIAYFSDATGEYELYLTQSDGKGETRQLTHDGKTFRFSPIWSPDSKSIVFTDSNGEIFLVTVATGQTKRIDTDPDAGQLNLQWSPDSRWLAYARAGNRWGENSTIRIYSMETGQSRQVTGGMFNDSNPVFDHKGDYLYFVSDRSYTAPRYDDTGQTWIYDNTAVLLAVPLRADLRSPYLPTSDEETFSPDTKARSVERSALSVKNQAEDTDREESDSTLDAQRSTLPAASSTLNAQRSTLPPDRKEEMPGNELADEVSGTWKGTAGSVSITLNLTLGADGKVTGAIESTEGNGNVTGAYDASAKTLNLTLVVGSITATLTAKIDGAGLTGTVLVQGQSLPLQAQRVGGAAAGSGASGAGSKASGEAAKPAAAAKPVKVSIDFDGFESRAILLPVRAGRFGQLAVNDRNQLIFARLNDADSGIKLFDLADDAKQEKMVVAGATNFDITPDGKKLLVVRGGNSALIQDASAGASGEAVVTAGMTTTIDPRQEWRQIFDDAWRLQRDLFYDPNMHHVDWKAIHDQYAKMLNDCASRDDVGYVIGEMISELNVGHAYYGGGDVAPEPAVSVGLLGVDFALNEGAYRIAKIYQGAPWDVEARGPLGQPGVDVKEGDYLLAVNGTPLDTAQDPWAAFQGLANRVVTLTVSRKPKLDSAARDVPVQLVGSEADLRYRAWIEQNRAYVDRKTAGHVGYIYVPSTGVDGQNDLVRQFMGQRDKDALIIDERWNSGGQIPDRFIELLNRPVTNYWARRAGKDWAWPPISHQGPKCMLINGLSGSGGDAFPWYFRQAKLGKLIGTRTWGGLVGLAGNPPLIDFADVTVPNFGFYKPNGTWAVEGHGVDPDIEVLDDPSLMVNGGDPQLDAGIQEMLTELKLHPYTPPKRPAYPDKRGMGIDPKDK
jgi:Tol biopolymer transport system component/C-terminal processing protease CtpA/Prc